MVNETKNFKRFPIKKVFFAHRSFRILIFAKLYAGTNVEKNNYKNKLPC